MTAQDAPAGDPFRDQLPAYALGALDPADAAALAAHLPTCAACQAELVRLQEATTALALSPPPAAEPAGHAERFRHKLARARRTSRQPRRRFLISFVV